MDASLVAAMRRAIRSAIHPDSRIGQSFSIITDHYAHAESIFRSLLIDNARKWWKL
ncbi:hypothetical protein [Paracoccus spongiarum]|uniref:Uncharacterized protein n=1 Tax=Paracoccus spongiarum TaxID=3064387 RepID=A0ABT9J9X8_9RHOB|nr:hypothetical protein [Paracoccus sp. 2205BS29-5]MDP5306624.1 hypothetical protein [Paracoccus sp. 2205BS29-5]